MHLLKSTVAETEVPAMSNSLKKSAGLFLISFILLWCMASPAQQAGKRTFSVDSVERAASPLAQLPGKDFITKRFGKAEGQSSPDISMVDYSLQSIPMTHYYLRPGKDFYDNAFLTTVYLAHSQHRPLVISPDMIWLLIMQGFNHHIQLHPEKLGIGTKIKTVKVYSPESDPSWDVVVRELSQALKKKIPSKKFDFLVPEFSTTGEKEAMAFQINMLQVFENNFAYEFYAVCGIPSITLEGGSDDWEKIIRLTAALKDYGLDWWISELTPVLDEFLKTSNGDINTAFWQGIYKARGEYTNTYVNGWITKFFPYIILPEKVTDDDDSGKEKTKRNRDRVIANPCFGGGNNAKAETMNGGLTHEQFPNGLSKVSFTLYRSPKDRGASRQAIAGFIGISQDTSTMALKPEIGWIIR
jgi:hypothetical protein